MKFTNLLLKSSLIAVSILFLFSCEKKDNEYVIEGVSLNLNQADLIPGDTVVLSASLQPFNQSVDEAISLDENLKELVFWRTSNSRVAVVDDKGVVIAKGAGSCDISFICGTLAAKCRITVRSFDKNGVFGLWDAESVGKKYLLTFEDTGYLYEQNDTSFFDWTFDGMRLSVIYKDIEKATEKLIITTLSESVISFYYADDKDKRSISMNRAPMPVSIEELEFGMGEIDGIGVVDMGLPNGTLWAACNLGAVNPADDGTRYSWAEIEPKDSYGLNDYKWFDAGKQAYTKYIGDDTLSLVAEDDPVASTLGEGWFTPSKKDFKELFENCYKYVAILDGKDGYLMIPKNESYNGKRLFIPCSLSSDNIGNGLSDYYQKSGFYWTSTRAESDKSEAYHLNIYVTDLYYGVGAAKRFLGMCIRPVYVEKN